MNESQLILLSLFAVAAAAAIFLWRQLSTVQARADAAEAATDEAKSATQKVRSEYKAKREENEKLREQLKSTKAKLEKSRATAAQDARTPRKRRGPEPKLSEPEPESLSITSGSAAQVVRVSSRELEETHRKAIVALEDKLSEARKRIAAFEEKERQRQKAAAEAAARLHAEAETPATPKTDTAASAEARIETLERELEATRTAAKNNNRARAKDLKRLEQRLEAAQRRAANDHAAYQVIKGHLEIAEDRLATLRRRYEGAKSPEQVAPKPSRNKKKRKAKNEGPASSTETIDPTVEAKQENPTDKTPPSGTHGVESPSKNSNTPLEVPLSAKAQEPGATTPKAPQTPSATPPSTQEQAAEDTTPEAQQTPLVTQTTPEAEASGIDATGESPSKPLDPPVSSGHETTIEAKKKESAKPVAVAEAVSTVSEATAEKFTTAPGPKEPSTDQATDDPHTGDSSPQSKSASAVTDLEAQEPTNVVEISAKSPPRPKLPQL